MILNIPKFTINLLKNVNGSKVFYINLSNLKLKKYNKSLKGKMKLKGSIEIDYLNRRK